MDLKDFDLKAYNDAVREKQSYRPGTREFSERVKREMEETSRSGILPKKECLFCGGTGVVNHWRLSSTKCALCGGVGQV